MKKKSRGREFEKAVAAIQAMMDPNCTVSHDENIEDKNGFFRQFDVVIRGKASGINLLGVIECKDWKAKVDLPVVDAFISKTKSVNANFSLIASNSGFTKKALELCKKEGIGTFSLIPNEHFDSRFEISKQIFAEIYGWREYKIRLRVAKPHSIAMNFSIDEIKYKNMKLIDWFATYLNNNYRESKDIGTFNKEVLFKDGISINIRDVEVNVGQILFSAERYRHYKSKWIDFSGHAVYDWSREVFVIPPKGEILSEPIKSNLEDWEPYEGEIPELAVELDFRMIGFERFEIDDDVEIIDILGL